MAYEKFAAATARAPLVFCDANFLVDLALHKSTGLRTALGAKGGALRRAADAAAFYARYRATRTDFISSPYTLEEIAHKVVQSALPAGAGTWKQLRKTNPTQYVLLRRVSLSLLNELWTQIQTYDIEFVVPRVSSGVRKRTLVQHEVADAAMVFFRAYDDLDMMDAFHVAMALACGAIWIATSDRAFQTVTEINVFSGV